MPWLAAYTDDEFIHTGVKVHVIRCGMMKIKANPKPLSVGEHQSNHLRRTFFLPFLRRLKMKVVTFRFDP